VIDLDRFPRVRLGHWPTPLEPCHRLQEELGGPLVWLKRDDCSGLALGGNKTRKLEFLLGEARSAGATGVVTLGAVQSNHARQTAAACSRLGLPCDLVLTESVDRTTVHYTTSGNRLLDDLLGATVHQVPDAETATEVASQLVDADPGRFLVETGGSTPVGALGYVAMVDELAGQLRAAGVVPRRLVTATASGDTAAGIVLGAALVDLDVEVLVAAVYESAAASRAVVEELIGETAAMLGEATPGTDTLVVDDAQLGDGYGVPTPADRSAIAVLARTEGVLLDPVYTGKAFALLLDRLPEWDSDEDVVFVHTGGQAGLFAYTDDLTDPSQAGLRHA
jgi:D-cysteine desulfhydrase family pyridoxal phosphate-dependent enzyme